MWNRRSPQRDGDCRVGSPAQDPTAPRGDRHPGWPCYRLRQQLAHSPAGSLVSLGVRRQLPRRHRSGRKSQRKPGQAAGWRGLGSDHWDHPGRRRRADTRSRQTRSALGPGPALGPRAPLRGGAMAREPAPPCHGISLRHLLGLGAILPPHSISRQSQASTCGMWPVADPTQGQLPGTERKVTSSYLF